MPWRELFGQEVLIRITDDDVGFVYSVKYAGVTLWHGFVPTLSEEEGPGGTLIVRREATKPDERDEDAR
jgi:hypothetical protein